MISLQRPVVNDSLLASVVQKIVAVFRPEKVILFGSRAWGTPHPDSDVDLLVIMDSALRPAQHSAEVSLACRPRGVAMDILVKTPAEVEHRLNIGDPFLRRILEQGKLMYAQ